jgi:biotin-(acetyl-CoA carboxylase) ligase
LTIYIHKPVWARQGQAISGLSVWLGNWLRHALQDLVEQPLFLKWPNDIVYIDPQGPGEGLRKVCGLLCRSQFVGRELAGVLCGFGVNVGQGLPLQVQEMESQEGYSPGFLRDLVSNPLAKGRVLRQILSELGQGLMGSRDMELIPEDLSSWLLWQGREVVLVPDQHYDGHGVRGLLQGVDKEGSLLIFVPEKNRTEAHVQGRLRAASKERT